MLEMKREDITYRRNGSARKHGMTILIHKYWLLMAIECCKDWSSSGDRSGIVL